MNQHARNNINHSLRLFIESITTDAIVISKKITTLTVSEYLDKISALHLYWLDTAGDFTDACDRIAKEALDNQHLYLTKDAFWDMDIDRVYFDTEKVIEKYKSSLIGIANELIEYKLLQHAVNHLDRNDLIKIRQATFFEKVSSLASFQFRLMLENIKAELSLCLTDLEKEELLVVEYRRRLSLFKEKAAISPIADSVFGLLPWQCFITQNLQHSLEGFVETHNFQYPSNIEFDLILGKHQIRVRNELKLETSKLASEWLLIDWIKNEISKFSSLITTISDQPQPAAKQADTPDLSFRTTPYTDEEKLMFVKKILLPLSGLNPSNKLIMSKMDFDRLVSYTNHLITTNCLPSTISPFKRIGISNGHISYTFFLLNQKLYGKRRHPKIIEFIHKVFDQFAKTSQSTTNAKFSISPKSYDSDFAGYIGEMK